MLWISVAFMGGVVLGSFTMSMLISSGAYNKAMGYYQERLHGAVDYLEDMYYQGKIEAAFKELKNQREGHDHGTY